MENENPIRTLGDYSRPSHKGYRNTIELPDGNNVVPLRSDTIWLVQNRFSFHGLQFKDPNQHLKDFLKLVDLLDLDVANRERTRLCLFQFSLRDQASNWLERLPAGLMRSLGGNTRDLSSILEETRQDCNFTQQSLEELFTEGGDGVRIACDAVWMIKRPRQKISNWLERLPARSISTREDLSNSFLAQFFPSGRTSKLRNEILMFQQHKGRCQSHDKTNHRSSGRCWNDPRDFAKPVKAIFMPHDVSSTSDSRLIELENQVQRLMEAHLAPNQPIQVNKMASSCEICSGLQDTQYCMENPEQAFVEYASSRADKAGVDMEREPTCPVLVGRGFLATVNAVIDCKKAKITVGEGLTRSIFGVRELDFEKENVPYWTTIDNHLPGEWEIARDAEVNPFKDILVFRKMVEFLRAIPINLKRNMRESEEVTDNKMDWDRPTKEGDGA
ncbi:hypothetical protein Tco_0698466 [Tanacetum coccineum]